MPDIHQLNLGDYRVNCYIVNAPGDSRCVLIDPGYAADLILQETGKLGLTPAAVLLTHGHFDHLGAVIDLVKRVDMPVYIHKEDATMPPHPLNHWLFPMANGNFPFHYYEPGEPLKVAGLTFHIHETPGHTQGGVCLECEDVMFTGDTLFAGTCGRTDLPRSDPEAMVASLRKLAQLPFQGAIYPGHGVPSTMDMEREGNPYMEDAL